MDGGEQTAGPEGEDFELVILQMLSQEILVSKLSLITQ